MTERDEQAAGFMVCLMAMYMLMGNRGGSNEMFYDNAQSTQSMLNGFYDCQSMNYAQQIRETCSNAVLSVQQQRLEDIRESYKDFPKSCFNCKHKIYGFQKGSCRMFNYCADTDPFAPIRQCIYNDRAYWSPDDATAELMGVRRKIQEASQDVTISELKNRIELLRIQQLQTNIVATHKEPPKPEKKYTVYDLYDLTFPDDPIKKHFITVCNNIEKRYQEKKKVLDQIEAPEVEIYHVEPLPTVTIDDHPIMDCLGEGLAATITLGMAALILYEIFFIIL